MKRSKDIYDHWFKAREDFNPLRSLTINRVVTLLEEAQTGTHSNFQWLCSFIERRFPVLSALIEKRTSPIIEMDWDIKLIEENAQAEAQAKALKAQYEAIDDLYDVIQFMALAAFRGFSHVEKVTDRDGNLIDLLKVDQWNVVQDGTANRWKYNPGAIAMSYQHFPDEDIIKPENFLIHRVKAPINEIAAEQFVRFKFSEKDWDAFIDIYGIPSGIVTLGPDSQNDDSYMALAEAVASGGSGVLPNGCDFKTNSSVRGEKNPFEQRLDYIERQIVLAGTGGQLTMLTESGSGTLAGGAHTETFNAIAAKDARKISETFQRQFDKVFIRKRFPGQPVLAYFDLNFKEENDTNGIVEHAAKLSAAGYKIKREILEEKTGYEFDEPEPEPVIDPSGQTAPKNPAQGTGSKDRKPDTQGDGSEDEDPKKNRASKDAENIAIKAFADVLGVMPDWLRPLRELILKIERKALDESVSEADYLDFLEKATESVPELFESLKIDDVTEIFEAAIGAATMVGASKGLRDNKNKNKTKE